MMKNADIGLITSKKLPNSDKIKILFYIRDMIPNKERRYGNE